jgi:hypothetical protein
MINSYFLDSPERQEDPGYDLNRFETKERGGDKQAENVKFSGPALLLGLQERLVR